MDTQAQLDTLNTFMLGLPLGVMNALADKNIDVVLATHDAGSSNGLVLREMGFVCEGVKRVLAGEDSAANLVAFIEKDQNIEEDNREKIPQIAYELQTKLFDVVFPVFKEAGLPLKEGRVAKPASSKEQVVSIKGETRGGIRETAGPGLLSPYAPVPSPIGPSAIRPVGPIRPISPLTRTTPTTPPSAPLLGQEGRNAAPPLEEKNIRALTRIAAGTAYTEDALRAAFEDLPQGLRQAISSVDTANAIQDIAKQYLLHVDQMGALASETGLVLLGLTHPAEFIGNLAKRLRLPEERAKEIARDISAKILVKVRDALRGLHEKPAYENTNYANIRMDTNKTVELPKKLNVMPSPLPKGVPPSPPARPASPELQRGEGGVLSPRSGVVGAAGRVVTTPGAPERATPFIKGDLPKATTPFSPSAKWNTGENILNKQAAEKEETLSREEVLRGIENPSSTYENTNYANRPMSDGRQTGPGRMDTNKTTAPPLTTNYKLPTTPIGPTGWRPAASGGNIEIRNPKSETNPNPQIQKNQPQAPRERPVASTPPKQPGEKMRPQSEGALPPEKPAQEPQNFLDEKLAGPTGLKREEKNYTTDPYREPLA